MEVILKEDVPNLGLRGDVVKVAEGYGRNYLKDGVVLSVGISAQKEGNFVALGLAGVGADSPEAPVPTRERASE